MRRTLLLREPLRRRPYGERHLAASHAPRRHRTAVTAPPFAPLVSRREVARVRRVA